MPPHVGRALAALALLGRDEARRHVGLAVDRVGVEQVALRVLDVDEDRVVLRRPAVARLGAVVVGPDQLVEEALAAEQLVEQQLAVVRLAVVDVEVQRARAGASRRRTSRSRGARGSRGSRRTRRGRRTRCSSRRGVAAAAEAGAVAVGVGVVASVRRVCVAAGVERRVEVGERDRRVRLGAQQRQVVAEQDPVHEATRRPGGRWACGDRRIGGRRPPPGCVLDHVKSLDSASLRP